MYNNFLNYRQAGVPEYAFMHGVDSLQDLQQRLRVQGPGVRGAVFAESTAVDLILGECLQWNAFIAPARVVQAAATRARRRLHR